MKKIFSLTLLMLVVSISYANVDTDKTKNATEKNEKVEKSDNSQIDSSTKIITDGEDEFCSATCSMVVNGVTIEESAGNFLTGCNAARSRCWKKLMRRMRAELEANE